MLPRKLESSCQVTSLVHASIMSNFSCATAKNDGTYYLDRVYWLSTTICNYYGSTVCRVRRSTLKIQTPLQDGVHPIECTI